MANQFDDAKVVTHNDVQTQSFDVERVEKTTTEAVTKAEIDTTIATAKKYPRNIGACIDEAVSMATRNEEIAGSCIYALPRGGKSIPGPSIRLAEIILSSWGNLKIGARQIEEARDHIVVEGICHDVQKNVLVSVPVRRKITRSDGSRYNEDMISMTAQAAVSIAIRNAIFKVVPRVYVEEVYQEALNVSTGKGMPIETRIENAMNVFNKMGVTKERVLDTLGRNSIEEITAGDLETLVGLKTAIKEGSVTVDDAFPDPEKETSKVKGSKDALKKKEGNDSKPKNTKATTKSNTDGKLEFE
jgi:hypothetical protein